MVDILQSSKLKAGTLFVALALIAAQGLAVSWNSPEADSSYKDPLTLNVTNNNNAANITFQIEGPNSQKVTREDVGGQEYVTYEFSAGSGNYGSYDFTVNSSENNSESITGVTLDGDSPEIDSKSPEGFVSDEDPNVELSASDPTTSVTEINVSVDGEEDSDSDKAEVSLDNLDDDEYTVDYSIKDDVGNLEEDSWSFTVDTSYDGDSSPNLDPEGGVVELGEYEDTDITVTLDENEESSDITVACYDSDDDEVDSETKDVDSETDFDCQVEGDDYSGNEEDIYVEMCDEAGNCEESDSYTYKFDGEAPIVSDLETSSGASSFNSEFDADFEVSDDVSDIESVEYYFESGTDEGDGESVDYSSGDSSFTVDPSDLESGEHTLYVRAKDEAERWSDTSSIKFDYYPDKTPEVSLTSSPEIQIISGNSKSFQVTVKNTGDIHIKSVDLKISSPIVSGSKTVEDLAEGDSESISFDIPTSKEDIGDYSLTVTAQSPYSTREISMRVKANQDQRDQIESNFSDIKDSFQDLEENVTRLKPKLGEEKRSDLTSNFSQINDSITGAEQALENEKFYEVKSVVDSFDSEFKQASKTYESLKEEYNQSQQMKVILVAVGLILVSLVAVLGYLLYSGRVERSSLRDHGIELGKIEDLRLKLESKLKGEEQAEEYSWDGFKRDQS